MKSNLTFYKILFAIELALIPMLFFAQFCLPVIWASGLVVVIMLVVKIWQEIFIDRLDENLNTINSSQNIILLSILLIMFIALNKVNVVLGVLVIIFNLLMNIFLIILKNKAMPKVIQSVDFLYMLLYCYTLFGLAFVNYFPVLSLIGLIAVLVCMAVSVFYKCFYIFKYTNFLTNFKKRK